MTALAFLPCLRCGEWAVAVGLIGGLERRETNACLRCDCEHFLEIKGTNRRYEFCYQRYTLRYPLEMYDDDVAMPTVHLFFGTAAKGTEERETFSGPVFVYPRRRYIRNAEVSAIWRASDGKCHLCRRRWGLAERSRFGLHIDHVIPHIGGGPETEQPDNLRVACWKCNLSKGRGFTATHVRVGLSRLVQRYHRLKHPAAPK